MILWTTGYMIKPATTILGKTGKTVDIIMTDKNTKKGEIAGSQKGSKTKTEVINVNWNIQIAPSQ